MLFLEKHFTYNLYKRSTLRLLLTKVNRLLRLDQTERQIFTQRPKGVFITSFKRADLLIDPRLPCCVLLSTLQHFSALFFTG